MARRTVEGGQMDRRERGQERRKKYYSPSEVRKRKGCIGCGGAGALATLALALALAVVLL